MLAWYWVLIAFIIGEAVGLFISAMCSANERNEHKYLR